MRYPFALLLCLLLPAATVDRLVITVGTTAITELQIDEDLRVAALFNGQPVSRDSESRRAAADRLVDQLLIQHEMDLSRYPAPSQQEVADYYSRTEQTLGGPEGLKALLDKYNLTEATLRAHLMSQLATLRFINFRFSPDVEISDAEIEAASAKNPDFKTSPPAADQRARIARLLSEERTDQALNTWLGESRKQVNIRYIDPSLR